MVYLSGVPVLFALYVNDLLFIPKHCETMVYVDNTKLFLARPPKEICKAIVAVNEDLRSVAKWFCENSLLINLDKTNILTV